MSLVSIDRATSQVLADSLNQSISIVKNDLVKAENLVLSELTVMLVRHYRKQLRELKSLRDDLLLFARSHDFSRKMIIKNRKVAA